MSFILYRHFTKIPVEIGDLNSKTSTFRFVRVLYVVCADDRTNGEYQSSNINKNKLDDALNLISLNIELLQTFISEILLFVLCLKYFD